MDKKEKVIEFILNSIKNNKKITIKLSGEDVQENGTMEQLERAINENLDSVPEWKINNFVGGKFPTLQVWLDSDYLISITIK